MTLAIRIEANSLLDEVKNVSSEKEKLKTENIELMHENKNQKAKIKDLESENKKVFGKLAEVEVMSCL